MKRTILLKLPLLFLAGLLAFSGCKKDDDAMSEESWVSAEDNARIETELESVQNFVDAEAADPDLEKNGPSQSNHLPASGCATRNWDAATRTLTIDFSPVNCLCRDGKYRRGQIKAVFSGAWRTAGSSVTITLHNYFVNDNQHLGTRIVTNQTDASNTNSNFKYSVTVQNASIIFTDATTRNWNAQRLVERTAGQGTPSLLDDEYLVTGTANGTNRRGVNYTAAIGQPLKKVFRPGCFRNFISGTITITNSNNKTLTLNYDPSGTENCDKTASVTVNGKTRLITLR
ncbi:MAG TPA: hypothetical protein VK927_11830 [Adhaeribacter sp.]|nr:hypothetical protein [Adhaeribacter sp.]